MFPSGILVVGGASRGRDRVRASIAKAYVSQGHGRGARRAGWRAGPSDMEKSGSCADVEFSPFQSRPVMAGAVGL